MTTKDIDLTGYPIIYSLNKEEQDTFNRLLMDNRADVKNPAVLKLLLKELNYDTNVLVRILYTDYISDKPIFYTMIYKKIIRLVKEAIILTEYKYHVQDDGFISLQAMSKLARFSLVDIDRNMIIRTFRKYGITYTKRR